MRVGGPARVVTAPFPKMTWRLAAASGVVGDAHVRHVAARFGNETGSEGAWTVARRWVRAILDSSTLLRSAVNYEERLPRTAFR